MGSLLVEPASMIATVPGVSADLKTRNSPGPPCRFRKCCSIESIAFSKDSSDYRSVDRARRSTLLECRCSPSRTSSPRSALSTARGLGASVASLTPSVYGILEQYPSMLKSLLLAAVPVACRTRRRRGIRLYCIE